MKFKLKNIGVLRQAEFELGDITVICGKNNTGKTYVTHSLYAFFDYIRRNSQFKIEQNVIDKLLKDGSVSINLLSYFEKIQMHVASTAKLYSKYLPEVFSGSKNKFEDASFTIELPKDTKFSPAGVEIKIGTSRENFLTIASSASKDVIDITMILGRESEEIPPLPILKNMIGGAVSSALLDNVMPRPFLASAERTGAAIFQKELDFTKNRIIEMLGDKSQKISPIQFLSKFSGEYPVAIRRNVDFIRDIPNLKNKDSYVFLKHKDILSSFADILGGEFKVGRDGEIQYSPSSNKSIKLTLVESSSSVRSLLDIGFYLRHVAREGDILMIDEPELNLHPENQRRVARLFASLANVGIKVFITTHSDYIIKEFSTLIMLKEGGEKCLTLAKKEGYKTSELIGHSKIKVYIAKNSSMLCDNAVRRVKCNTLISADISPSTGISAESFDSTIEDMNRIQEKIIWGLEDD